MTSVVRFATVCSVTRYTTRKELKRFLINFHRNMQKEDFTCKFIERIKLNTKKGPLLMLEMDQFRESVSDPVPLYGFGF